MAGPLPGDALCRQRGDRPAKEATVKAMGTGFRHGIWIRDVGVVNNDWGRPEIIWSARGQGVCDKLGISGGHVSLSDDAGLILAFAVVMQAQ
jgi:holo-[acyl-carrier protein] synthase